MTHRTKPLFPTSDINFSSGKYKPKSKNTAAQPSLFQRSDPYARNLPQTIRQALATGVQAGSPTTQLPTIQRTTAPTIQSSTPQNEPRLQSVYDPNEAANYTISPPGQVSRPAGQPVNPNNPNQQVANASRLLMQAMSGNPFITPEGLQRMQRGFAPLENEINPAFYRYTSPVIQQALSGLRQSVGYRPEEQQFTAAQMRPRSLY